MAINVEFLRQTLKALRRKPHIKLILHILNGTVLQRTHINIYTSFFFFFFTKAGSMYWHPLLSLKLLGANEKIKQKCISLLTFFICLRGTCRRITDRLWFLNKHQQKWLQIVKNHWTYLKCLVFFKKQLNERDLVACQTCLKSSETIQTHADDFTIIDKLWFSNTEDFQPRERTVDKGN